jgi:hypothetical protein
VVGRHVKLVARRWIVQFRDAPKMLPCCGQQWKPVLVSYQPSSYGYLPVPLLRSI